jgi:hypothetical protein
MNLSPFFSPWREDELRRRFARWSAPSLIGTIDGKHFPAPVPMSQVGGEVAPPRIFHTIHFLEKAEKQLIIC